jgi:hypothetical protein
MRNRREVGNATWHNREVGNYEGDFIPSFLWQETIGKLKMKFFDHISSKIKVPRNFYATIFFSRATEK